MAEDILLDTSAIVAFLAAEDGAEDVEKFLRAAARSSLTVYASFATVAELFAVTMKQEGRDRAEHYLSLVRAWPMSWVQSDDELCVAAGMLKGRHRMSLADAFIAATALRHGAVLVHKDPEFEPLKAELRQHTLPYKRTHG